MSRSFRRCRLNNAIIFYQGKICPCLERSCFVHSRYDEAEAVGDGIIVCVQYASALYLVITPCGKKFVGKMVVIITCHFDD